MRKIKVVPEILKSYRDEDEMRPWTILQGYDQKTAYKEYPDYDVAYIRAAGPLESGGSPGNWKNDILNEGLKNSKLKSRLLFHLAANNLFQGNGTEAFIQSMQAFHAIKSLPQGAGPHVFIFYYCWYIFQHFDYPTNQVSPCELIAMNSLGVEISSSDNKKIKQVAADTFKLFEKQLVDEAERIIRVKFKEKEQEYEFPAFYETTAPQTKEPKLVPPNESGGLKDWFLKYINDVVPKRAKPGIQVPFTEPAKPRVEDLPGGAKMEFVYIPPGTFMMGSPSNEAGRLGNEGPQHQVTISKGFYLGKYVVTQGQWEAVMGTTPWEGQDFVQPNPTHPAVYVSWNDAQVFVQALNALAGDPLYRLPTEAEWEYACRAGTTTRWSFGGDESKLGDYAWYDVNAWDVGNKYAHAVGTKLPNPWGLYDMHGNVWEWAQDWYGDYTSTAKVDPTGPSSGSYRVYRGGPFDHYAQFTRSANRSNASSPSYRSYDLGFRLLRIE